MDDLEGGTFSCIICRKFLMSSRVSGGGFGWRGLGKEGSFMGR